MHGKSHGAALPLFHRKHEALQNVIQQLMDGLGDGSGL
jgi:hypothetical protein